MTQPVRPYRLYFVDRHQHIGKALDIEAPTDDEARAIAAAMFAEQSHYAGVEVWQQSRRITGDPASQDEASARRVEQVASDSVNGIAPRLLIVGDETRRASSNGGSIGGHSNGHDETEDASTPIHAEIAARFGILPNFFRSAGAAPGLIDELWNFALAAYLNNPLPSLFKERLFVFLSRLCPVRYCLARHVGFLIGLGRPAGDAAVRLQTVDEVVSLLARRTPDSAALDLTLSRLSDHAASPAIPEVGTPFEADLFDALVILFLTPLASPRIREAVRRATGETNFEYLVAFLAFIRTAHYWTETHPEIEFEPDLLHLMNRHEELARLLLASPGAFARA